MKLAYFFPHQQNTCLIVRHNARLTILMINRLATNENKTFLSIFSLILLIFFSNIANIYLFHKYLFNPNVCIYVKKSHLGYISECEASLLYIMSWV